MIQPTEKRTCLSKDSIDRCRKHIKERLCWYRSCIWLSIAVLLIIPGFIGFRTFIEKPLEGGATGAIMSIFIWTVIWIIGPEKCIISITALIQAIKSMIAGDYKPAISFLDTILSQKEDSSYSDQSFDSKPHQNLSLRGDNSIWENNFAGANVEDITKNAKKGNVDAQYDLGVMYYEGIKVPKEIEKAVDWFTRSAEQGDKEAQYTLGVIYYQGKSIQQDYQKAIYWLTKSAEQDDAEAQLFLGVMYYEGKGILQDYKKAFEWLTKSAEQDNAGAQFLLSVMYYSGEGTLQDFEHAADWVTKSAKQGQAKAQYTLGAMYADGKVFMQDYTKAYMWFNLASHNGYSEGQKARDIMARKLSPQDLIEAQKMSQHCLKSRYEDC